MDLFTVGELGGDGLAGGVAVAAFLAGLRHGFDIDHVAAISDITSSQRSRTRSLALATTYALGHMLVVFVLGVAAVYAGDRVSESIDALAGRLIGFSLVALGLYVVYSIARFRRDFRMRSRWMIVLAGARRALHRLRPDRLVVIEHEHEHAEGHHSHAHTVEAASGTEPVRGALATETTTHAHSHRHVVPMPADPFTDYGVGTSFGVGMIHGVGAESPTQVLLFTSAAGIAGTLAGVALVGAFVAGLLLGNTLLAIATTAGFAGAGRRMPAAYMVLAGLTALVSVWVGSAYLLDRPELLPSIFGY